MLSSIKQVKVGRGIPMLCIRSIVHHINIYSRIVIQLNMYVKIITSSGFIKINNFDGFCARTASGSVSLWPMLEISRKYTYLPEVVVSSAGSSTTRAARHKMEKKIGAEFMTSVSYRPEVTRRSIKRCLVGAIQMKTKFCHHICIVPQQQCTLLYYFNVSYQSI
jgi:hypothetical protein